jgi:hypothetical protein
MAGCTRAGAVLLAALLSGCVTGHVWQAGRRWEQPTAFEQASIDGDRLVVRYAAQVTDDDGVPIAARTRRAALPLGSLRAAGQAAEDVRVHPLDDAGAMPGTSVALETAPPAAAGAPVSLVVHDPRVPASIPGNVFTRTSTAGWVYPLMPLAVCVDATSLPILLFFAPGPMVIGD